jgi:hypothetical protein
MQYVEKEERREWMKLRGKSTHRCEYNIKMDSVKI